MKPKQECVMALGPLIIGAGPSGLATAACLREKGIPSLILERENCIASLWNLKTSDCMKLHLPKRFCELPLMPFPPEFPTYPTKWQFISYLEAYAQQFSVEPVFGEEVKQAEYDQRIAMWRVLTSKSEYICRWLIVATGENAEAVLPNIAGISEFRGRVLHSSSYGNGAGFKGEEVLVVGCGNSGMEICLDLSIYCAQPSMVVRNKMHILPKEMLGKSTFAVSMWLLKWFPLKLVDALILFYSRLVLGDTVQFGLERPKIGPLQLKNDTGRTPVLDVGTFAKIKSGQIKVVPSIRQFTDTGAEFVDGVSKEFDSLILATGFRSSVPKWLKEEAFFDKDGIPRMPFPNGWKGKDGLYAVGFTKRGLLGASISAQRVAEDIACHWDCETKNTCVWSFRPY